MAASLRVCNIEIPEHLLDPDKACLFVHYHFLCYTIMTLLLILFQPTHCKVVLWGQDPGSFCGQMAQIEGSFKAIESAFDLGDSATTLSQLEEEGICCIKVEGKWMRAKPCSYVLDKKGCLKIVCIDDGTSQSVPLTSLHLLPPNAHFLKSFSPLASKYILADVLVTNFCPHRASAIK